jgi:hypothetical protein
MKFRLQLTKDALYGRWAWTSAAAILVFLPLLWLDRTLGAATGDGILALQRAANGADVRFILDRWQDQQDASLAGFLVGLDFLFIPLYGAALYYGAVVARETFAPGFGLWRRFLDALTMVPLLAAACDAAENLLELAMLRSGPSDALVSLAGTATAIKNAGIAVGLILSLAAATALLFRRRKPR